MPNECKTSTVTNAIGIQIGAQYRSGSGVQRNETCKKAKKCGLSSSVGAGQQSYPAGIEI